MGEEAAYQKLTTAEILFFLLSGALFGITGYLWKNLILGAISTQPMDYVLPLIATIGFSVAFTLTATLATARWLGWVTFPIAVSAAIALIPLWAGNYVIAIIATIITSLALIYALYAIRSAYANSIIFDAPHVVKAGLPWVFTGITILMSFYYLHAQLSRPIRIVPTGLIEGIVSLTSGMLGQQLGVEGQRGNAKTPQQEQSPSLLLKNLPPELSKLIPSNLLEIFDGSKATPSIKQQTQKNNKRQEPAKTPTQQIAEIIRLQIDKLIEPYKPFIPFIFTVLFFFSVRSLMSILAWLIVPLTSIVLKFLIAIGIVHKRKVQVEAERVSLI